MRVPFEQRNEPPTQPKVVYALILDINYFCHFLDILKNYNLVDDESMWVADRVVALTPGSAITIPETANEFAIKGNHLPFVKENQFDARFKTDSHKHIHEFLGICDMFKYRDTKNEAVCLMMFTLSLTGEAKTWLDELNEGTIKTWDEIHTAFISRLFPLAFFDRLLGEIRAFLQHENETLTEAWLRMKEMLRNYHCRNLSKGNIINIFFTASTKQLKNDDEDEESTPRPKSQTQIHVKETSIAKPYKPKIPYPQRLRKEKMKAQYGNFLDMIRAIRINVPLVNVLAGMPNYGNIDIIDEILEEYFDALLDERSKILHSIKETILEEKLYAEFNEFMAMTVDENFESESESEIEEPPFENITINTDYKIKTS
nr:reverse transcriptase domain-containing protein [Tanacetum cinerariifolium]